MLLRRDNFELNQRTNDILVISVFSTGKPFRIRLVLTLGPLETLLILA